MSEGQLACDLRSIAPLLSPEHARPLDLAAYKGNVDIIALLLDKGAMIEHADLSGAKPQD